MATRKALKRSLRYPMMSLRLLLQNRLLTSNSKRPQSSLRKRFSHKSYRMRTMKKKIYRHWSPRQIENNPKRSRKPIQATMRSIQSIASLSPSRNRQMQVARSAMKSSRFRCKSQRKRKSQRLKRDRRLRHAKQQQGRSADESSSNWRIM